MRIDFYKDAFGRMDIDLEKASLVQRRVEECEKALQKRSELVEKTSQNSKHPPDV